MSEKRQAVRKLRAFEAGKALPKYSTIHQFVADDPAFLAFVRMSGETRPWGIAFGRKGSPIEIHTVLDGRNRDQIQEMLESFSISLLEYLRAENFTFDPISKDSLGLDAPPQIWVPNSSHLDMLHFINYMFWRESKGDGMQTHRGALARLCGWLFRESKVAGQQLLVDSAKVLRENYVFPVDEVTISNPAVALEWMKPRGSIKAQVAHARTFAADAAGTTLEPKVEKELAKLIVEPEANKVQIEMILTEELERRWSLAVSAHNALLEDSRKTNAGCEALLKDSLLRYVYKFQTGERQAAGPDGTPPFTPHPETDNHGSAAAANYLEVAAAEEKLLAVLIHDDDDLLKDALLEGTAIAGVVVEVLVEKTGVRAKKISWVIRVEARDEIRLREGDKFVLKGTKSHEVQVVGLAFLGESTIDITLEWKKGTIQPIADTGLKSESPEWIDRKYYFVPGDSSHFLPRSVQRVWSARTGRGAWLTHGQSAISADANVRDDVAQLEGK